MIKFGADKLHPTDEPQNASNDVGAPKAKLSRFRLTPLTLFNRQWWWSTLLVLVVMGILLRLGFWQLDRLAQRQARNAAITHQLALAPLSLNSSVPFPDDPASLKNRLATATGEYDLSRQVALKLQNWEGSPGLHLITPLLLEDGSRAVLVDRGWIPYDHASSEKWSQFDELGPVAMTGFIRLSETLAREKTETSQPNLNAPQAEWYRVDIEAIQAQLPYELLPIFLQQSPPERDNTHLPYRREPTVDLSEGPHLSYAIQWYLFALILGGGYLYYVNREITKETE